MRSSSLYNTYYYRQSLKFLLGEVAFNCERTKSNQLKMRYWFIIHSKLIDFWFLKVCSFSTHRQHSRILILYSKQKNKSQKDTGVHFRYTYMFPTRQPRRPECCVDLSGDMFFYYFPPVFLSPSGFISKMYTTYSTYLCDRGYVQLSVKLNIFTNMNKTRC